MGKAVPLRCAEAQLLNLDAEHKHAAEQNTCVEAAASSLWALASLAFVDLYAEFGPDEVEIYEEMLTHIENLRVIKKDFSAQRFLALIRALLRDSTELKVPYDRNCSRCNHIFRGNGSRIRTLVYSMLMDCEPSRRSETCCERIRILFSLAEDESRDFFEFRQKLTLFTEHCSGIVKDYRDVRLARNEMYSKVQHLRYATFFLAGDLASERGRKK